MMGAGIQLMVLGMSVVIVFLIVLVLFIGLAAAVVRRFTPFAAAQPGALGSAAGATDTPQGETDGSCNYLVAAVLAAVAIHHRLRHASTVSGGEHR